MIVVVGLIIAAILSSETAMNWLKDAWEVTKNFLIGVWEAISGAVMEVWDGMTQWITENQESISKVIERVWGVIGDNKRSSCIYRSYFSRSLACYQTYSGSGVGFLSNANWIGLKKSSGTL